MISLMGCAGIGGTGGTVDETITTPKQKVFQGKVSQVNTSASEFTLNGTQFSLADATISRKAINPNSETITAGQILTVQAIDSDKDGVFEASSIEIDDQLTGPISSIDLVLNTITISGSTVSITEATSFSDKSLSTVVVGNYVAVFGFRGDTGILEATLVEILKNSFSPAIDTVKVVGEVTDVNNENGTITVDGVDINVDENDIKDIQIGDTVKLDNIEVNSNVPNGLSTQNSAPSLVAVVKNYEIDTEIVLEGFPRKITAKNIFNLNGYQVLVPVELLKAANIESVENRKVIIEAKFVGELSVVAKSIRVEENKDFELRGLLERSNEENTVLVFSQKIQINRFTFLNFDLETVLKKTDAGTSSVVFVRGYVDSSGNKIATNIILKKDETENLRSLDGKVESIANGVLKISGVSVRFNSMVESNGLTVVGTELLASITIGDEITVFGKFTEERIFLASAVEVDKQSHSGADVTEPNNREIPKVKESNLLRVLK